MKKALSLSFILAASLIASAQQQTYDVLTYLLPKGWQKKEVNGGLQLAIIDTKAAAYATIVIIKSTPSSASIDEGFDLYWDKLIKATVTISEKPSMQQVTKDNGWDIVSGNAPYTDGNIAGLATLITAVGGGKITGVAIMTNTGQYQAELLAFIRSLSLSKATTNAGAGAKPSLPANNKNKISLIGLWADYVVEKNAYQQYTTGYLRKEYTFNADGTYLFRKKNFLSNSTHIYFMSETGTYSISANKLTLVPKQGSTQFWNKPKSLKNNEWGSFVRSEKHKLETVTYTFEILEDPTYGNSITLKPSKATTRDGGQFNAPDDPFKFNYAFRSAASLIDNPPGVRK